MAHSSQSSITTNIPTGAWQGLEQALQHLSSEQINLLMLTSVLGEADWSYTMLAAVVLLPPTEVRQALTVLIDRGLVTRTRSDRYQISSLVREAARQRFSTQDFGAYTQQAARALFGYACLDRALDCVQAIQEQQTPSMPAHSIRDRIDATFVQEFRDRIQPEIVHIQQALTWAEQDQVWNLFLRFAFVPCLDLLTDPGTSDLHQYPVLQMATLDRPTLTNGNLNTALSASHIIDGIFNKLFMLDAKWWGVRAPGLLLQDVTMVDSQLMACDLRKSLWVRCDAQKAIFTDCDLTSALLRNVKLYKAQLPEIQLAGATLIGVKLQGANLQGANLRGAVLYDVDLSGADLRGADLTGVAAQQLNVQGCQVEGVCWDDASINTPLDNQPPATTFLGTQAREWLQNVIESLETKLDAQAVSQHDDLRAADLAGSNLIAADLSEADLRAATLSEATLSEANLSGVQLQAAQLASADLHKANMVGANLRAADARRANLSDAVLRNADAAYANFQGARLERAVLQKANLSHANLLRANLTGADLRGAIYTGANLRNATITREQLLQAARLDGATLPNGDTVERLDGYYDQNDTIDDRALQFAFCDGMFSSVAFGNTTMAGAQLPGAFSHCSWIDTDLSDAHLSGNFSHCDFGQANLVNAHLSGSFYEVNFREVALTRTNLSGAILINVDLTGTEVSEAQLRQAHALRGTYLPDGTIYDGRYRLPVDIETASNLGYDPENEAEWVEFCSSREPEFKRM